MNTNNVSTIFPNIEIQRAKNIGPVIHILHLNIEGISKSKGECASKIAREHSIDVIALQETHTLTDDDISNRGLIDGYRIVAHVPSRVYGIATYVRNAINDYSVVSESNVNDISTIVLEISGVTVVNVYKPPNVSWMNNQIIVQPGPAVYVGDFNSHHTSWGYSTDDHNGELLCNWADSNQLHLIYDAKDRGTFRSARWRLDYNPDLCFVSSNNRNQPIHVSRSVLCDFPKSQHRPVKISAGLTIRIVDSIQRSRWNFQKANWPKFQLEIDANIRWIAPRRANYGRFVGVVNAAAKRNIPRGYRKKYIPGWSNDLERLYNEFEESGDPEISEELLDALNANRKEKWAKTTENMNFTRSSRKAWNILRKLGAAKNTVQRKSQNCSSPQI